MELRSVIDLVDMLAGGLIVSCHKDPDKQSDGQEILLSYVRAAEKGGAAGLRVQGLDENSGGRVTSVSDASRKMLNSFSLSKFSTMT